MAYVRDVYKAAGAGIQAQFETVLAARPDLIDTPNFDGYTPFHNAAKKGRSHILRFLVAQGSRSINATNRWGETPLCLAIKNRHYVTMIELIQLGCDKTQPDSYQTYYEVALQFSNWKAFEILVRWNFPGFDTMQRKMENCGFPYPNPVLAIPPTGDLIDLYQGNRYETGANSSSSIDRKAELIQFLVDRKYLDLQHPVVGVKCWVAAIGYGWLHVLAVLIRNFAAGLDPIESPHSTSILPAAVRSGRRDILELILRLGSQTLNIDWRDLRSVYYRSEMTTILLAVSPDLIIALPNNPVETDWIQYPSEEEIRMIRGRIFFQLSLLDRLLERL